MVAEETMPGTIFDTDGPVTDRPSLNLRVLGTGAGFSFGNYRHGTVIPKWVAELSGSTAESLVASGTFEWTHDEPSLDHEFKTPELATDDEADEKTAAMTEELERLRRQNTTLRAENKAVVGQIAELKATNALHVKSLGEQTAEIARLKVLADGYRLKAEQLAKDMELTNPRTPPVDPKAVEIIKDQTKRAEASKAAPKTNRPE